MIWQRNRVNQSPNSIWPTTFQNILKNTKDGALKSLDAFTNVKLTPELLIGSLGLSVPNDLSQTLRNCYTNILCKKKDLGR